MTRIVIIEDHPTVREGVKRALVSSGFNEIFEASNIAEARARISQINPELIIVDLNLPDGSGFELISWARSISQEIAIVVLSLFEDGNHIIAAMKAGASSYVCKNAPLPQLMASVNFSLANPLSFSAIGLSGAIENLERQKGLTAREFDILALLETGISTRNIALQLFISQATVKTHLASIYRKLDVSNRTAAVHAFHLIALPK
jgi:DNA-binding NarL/FixJ family response regulator